MDTVIALSDGHLPLTSLTVDRADVRQGSVSIASVLHQAFAAWLAGLRVAVAGNKADADRLREEGVVARRAAAAIVFEHADELAAARLKVDRIERAIESAADSVDQEDGLVQPASQAA